MNFSARTAKDMPALTEVVHHGLTYTKAGIDLWFDGSDGQHTDADINLLLLGGATVTFIPAGGAHRLTQHVARLV